MLLLFHDSDLEFHKFIRIMEYFISKNFYNVFFPTGIDMNVIKLNLCLK